MKRIAVFCSGVFLSVVAFAAVAHEDHADRVTDGKLGGVLFKTSCTPEAQKQFERALALLHSFYFPDTIDAFKHVAEIDPSCGIAYWGIATSMRPNPLVGPFDSATLKRGVEAVQKGQEVGARTQREREWIAAITEFYKDYETVDQDTRTRKYERAMARLVQKYPSDVEAKIFHALALNEVFDHKDHAPLLEAVKILEPLDRAYPDHPGIPHYLIHSYDFPLLAQRGVRAADKYAKVAPAAPHAQHMPSHIYSMLGMWNESIASNRRSIEVAKEYAAQKKLGGVFWSIPHSQDFIQYAYLQLGQDGNARALVEEVLAIEKPIGWRYSTECGAAATVARYYLERQDWKGAAALQIADVVKAPQAQAITIFTRALGAARTGDVAAAQSDIEKLQGLRAALEKASQRYWAEQVEIEVLAAHAWLANARGDKTDALKVMRAAADLEDASEKHVAMENRLYPMRELLGDLLMLHGQPSVALKEYEASMVNAPNRLRGYYGAAKAAELSGNKSKAATYLARLAELTKTADSDRAEIRESRQRLTSR
jgi:tetratricopeptide (TPR) repeat protein